MTGLLAEMFGNTRRFLERLGELPRALVDALYDATLVVELVDRVLKLLV